MINMIGIRIFSVVDTKHLVMIMINMIGKLDFSEKLTQSQHSGFCMPSLH